MPTYKPGDRLQNSEGDVFYIKDSFTVGGTTYVLVNCYDSHVAIAKATDWDGSDFTRTGSCSTADHRIVISEASQDLQRLSDLLTEEDIWDAPLLGYVRRYCRRPELLEKAVYGMLGPRGRDMLASSPPDTEDIPQIKLKPTAPQTPNATSQVQVATTIISTTNEDTKTMSTPTTRSKKTQIIDSMKIGAQTGLADEAGNALLQIADKMTDGKVTFHCPTPETQALLKLVTATLLIHGIDLFETEEATKNNVTAACGLVIQAATRDFIQPKMKEIRSATMGLANIGQRSLEAPKTNP